MIYSASGVASGSGAVVVGRYVVPSSLWFIKFLVISCTKMKNCSIIRCNSALMSSSSSFGKAEVPWASSPTTGLADDDVERTAIKAKANKIVNFIMSD